MHLISTEDLNVLCNHAEDGGHGDVVDIIKRRVKSGTGINEVAKLRDQIRDALEGDSNDAEHDALVSVADAIGLHYSDMASDMEASVMFTESDTADAREDMQRDRITATLEFETEAYDPALTAYEALLGLVCTVRLRGGDEFVGMLDNVHIDPVSGQSMAVFQPYADGKRLEVEPHTLDIYGQIKSAVVL